MALRRYLGDSAMFLLTGKNEETLHFMAADQYHLRLDTQKSFVEGRTQAEYIVVGNNGGLGRVIVTHDSVRHVTG
ncbi:MAG: hypothetical protein GC129_05920 [Proteobacteria bacterium]|nr:hypothetical protein [Pseudomonadota bacterium]